MKDQFTLWCSTQLKEQIEAQKNVSMENIALQPIDLSLPLMKEIGTTWLEKTAQYISDNPQFIVNGFVRAGICRTPDGYSPDDELDGSVEKMDEEMMNSTSSSSDDDEPTHDGGHTDFQCSKVAAIAEQVDLYNLKSLHNTTHPIVLYSDSSDSDT